MSTGYQAIYLRSWMVLVLAITQKLVQGTSIAGRKQLLKKNVGGVQGSRMWFWRTCNASTIQRTPWTDRCCSLCRLHDASVLDSKMPPVCNKSNPADMRPHEVLAPEWWQLRQFLQFLPVSLHNSIIIQKNMAMFIHFRASPQSRLTFHNSPYTHPGAQPSQLLACTPRGRRGIRASNRINHVSIVTSSHLGHRKLK